MKFLKRTFVIIIMSSIILASSVPSVISFQGRLLDTGTPITATKNMRFEIVNNSDAVIWQSHALNSTQVYVNRGIYFIKLGDTSLVNMSALELSNIDQNVTLNLRVYVEGTQLTPDIFFSATPYAFIARQAEIITANVVAGNSIAAALGKATDSVTFNSHVTIGGLLTVNDALDMSTVTATFTVKY